MKVQAIGFAVVAAMSAGLGVAGAQGIKAPRYQGTAVESPMRQVNMPALPPAITPQGTVVEDVVVRVNDQIISRSDVARANEQMLQEAAANNLNSTEVATRQKDMLRDMIDQQLLLSRAKELGLNADADVIRRLDDIRKQNKMSSMDELEKAAKSQNVSFEDFKAQIRNQILTQQVVRDEVGRRLQVTQGEEAKFYDAHKKDFEQPEQVRLSEILVPLPETATPAQIAQAEATAKELKSKIMAGSDFAEVSKKSSGGPTATQGGELGLFKRGALAKVIEDQTFELKAGETTQPIRTRQGYVILKVAEHDQAGPAPMKDVEQQIQEAMYMDAMQPALRTYLTKLREQAYIDVQNGFVDSGASGKETKPVFTAYAAPAVKKKKTTQKARFDRRGGASAATAKAVMSSPDTTGGRTLTGAEARANADPSVDPVTGLAVIAPPKATARTSSAGSLAKVSKKEKIRFGQAPRNSLAAGTEDEVASTDGGAIVAGVTPATAAANTDLQDNLLNAPEAPRVKTRYAAQAKVEHEKKAQVLTAKQVEKQTAKPIAMTPEEAAAAKVQAAPLGLSGDTSKKPKKAAKVKGAPKQRLEEKKPEPAPVATPVDQTASPTLAPTATTPASTPVAPSTTPPQM